MNEKELATCLLFNRLNHRKLIRLVFSIFSRLGDGVFWYTMMLVLPLVYPEEGLKVTLMMVPSGLIYLALYKLLKTRTERQRPCSYSQQILQGMPALDQYSFPSGHTMHAVGFSWIALTYYPELALIILPFTAMVALSRLVLGLHYPTDVFAGALIGTGIAILVLLY